MNKILYTVSALLFSATFYAQTDGFWDKERATTKEISLSAGKRALIKTEDLPVGTTEFVYRITLLDEGQKLTSSLVSVLKAIPDPTGISQGTAGAIQLTSAISGDDKCTYALFQEANAANVFFKDGKTDKACFEQKEKVNKEAKLISSSSLCLTNLPNLWFGFESQNWLMNQKIVLEVVPWVDYKASRGWDKTTKNEILTIAKKLPVVSKLTKKDQFYAVFIENMAKKFTYRDFLQLLTVEKNNAIDKLTEESLKSTSELKAYYDIIREKSFAAFQKGNYEEAITIISSEMMAKNRATYIDYEILGDYYLFSKQFTKAEETYNKGLKLNPSEIHFQLNLAHIYLFTDRISDAKDIHKKYAHESLSNGKTWIAQTKLDFTTFEKYGLPTDDFKKILRVIE
ncbi:tetratricopeptide repeat protein [uncultured Flavobacterium sp.]|jgi:tetratricopeptide (TPR) repeat protein|uniref:tetratricopeptide repeat protein n=1 Tax=uncultured Flavobacterium sp. TaxID=165435 RepID=UPI0025928402|nr:tetratricopeptide repeat protein [uncultured Flavobacterium sp.]